MTSPRGLSAEHVVAIAFAALATACLMILGCASAPPPPKPVEPPAPVVEPKPVPPQAPPTRAALEDYSPRRRVEVEVDAARLAGKKGAELWVTADGGQNWSNQGPIDASRPTAPYLAPRDGRYGFAVVALSQDGTRDVTPKAGDAPARTVVVDTVPPVVEVLSPNGGEFFGTGRSTIVQWVAQDAHLHPEGISVEVAAAAAEGWSVVAKGLPNAGKYHWDIAVPTGAYRLRVVARDLAGNEGRDASDREFAVDGHAPDLRILGPAAANGVPVQVEYSATDPGGAGLKRISLYVTRDQGQSWIHAGDDDDLRSPFPFTDLDGVYGLRLVGEDKVGNAQPPPAPGTPALAGLVLDRGRPEVKLLSPADGGILGGVPTEIRWTARDAVDMAANAVSLHFSEDGGKTWKEIAKGQKNDGLLAWTPPKNALADCRVRAVAVDTAGNRGEAASGRFGIDTEIPEARALGPDRSNSNTVQIAYEIRNRGAAPVKRVTLWVRPENVKEWQKHGDDPDAQSPVQFARADGKYALYVTCATEAGLKGDFVQKDPDPQTEAQVVLTIDSMPPQVHLESLNGGGYLMAGSAVDVLWKLVEPNPDPAGARIFHSSDGGVTWDLVAGRVDAAKGSYRWVVPASHGARHKMRVSVSDRFGNTAQVESERPFTIDTDRPSVTILEKSPVVTRSTRAAVKYKASDGTSGVDRVVLYAKSMGDRSPYKVLAENRSPEGTLEGELPGEGTWGLVVVAMDAAGFASSDPARAEKPDCTVAVDVTKPELALKDSMLPQGTKTWLNPNWEVEWRATDNVTTTERIQVRVERSEDGGKAWIVVATTANAGKYDLRAHLFPGKRYRLRVVAIDEAGNEDEKSSADFDPGDIPPPPLALRGIEDGRPYVVGTRVVVMWMSPDKTVREATLELSKDGGRTWSLLARMSTSSMSVSIPEKEGRYHVRAAARDSVGRPFASNVIAFDAVTGVDQVRIVTNPVVEPGKAAQVLLEPKEVLARAKALRLEISEDGRDWRKVADVRNPVTTFPGPQVTGEYVIRVVMTDLEGKEYNSNHARFRVGNPGVQLLTFRGGQSSAAGGGALVMVKTDADPADLRLDFSDTSGKTWKPVEAVDYRAIKGGLFWRLPAAPGATCRLRVSYIDAQGKVHADQSESDFAIEGKGVEAAPLPATGPVRLETPIPAVVKGGAVVELRWTGADPEAVVRLSLSVGEKPEVVSEALPASGTLSWKVPRIDAKACALVFEAGGKVTRTPFFEIDSRAPSVDGVDIELPKR